jgi:signal peptidase I
MDNPDTTPPAELPGSSIPLQSASASLGQRSVRLVLDVLETLLMALILFVLINVVSARIRVDGPSMEPTLVSGELVMVNKLAYRFGTPEIGDIVVFYFPRDPAQEYIKRLIGLPGDQVSIDAGIVSVNGVPLNEPYLAYQPKYTGTWVVPDGQVFVLGDNRNNSSDSHSWGTVPLEYIVGKALLVYWPPQFWKMLDTAAPALAAPGKEPAIR